MQPELDKAIAILQQITIPPLPQEIILIKEELASHYPNTVKIAGLISRNPELLNPFLELVNHRIMRPKAPIRDARSAINLLGLDDLYTLFLASLMAKQITETEAEREILAQGARAGIATAELSYWVQDITRAEAYLIGLTQNIGGIFLERATGDFFHFFTRQLSHPFSAYKEELDYFGTAHTFVGAIVGKRWHLSDTINKAILLHHDPQFVVHTSGDSQKIRQLVALIFVANYVVSSTLGETYITQELKEAYQLGCDLLDLPDTAIRAATAAVLKWGPSALLVDASH